MPKATKTIFCILMLVLSIFLSACVTFKPNKKYADKISKSILEGNPYSYETVIKQLGEPTKYKNFDNDLKQGYCVWLEGYQTIEEATEDLDSKDIFGLVITFEKGKATGAIYAKWTGFEDDITKGE